MPTPSSSTAIASSRFDADQTEERSSKLRQNGSVTLTPSNSPTRENGAGGETSVADVPAKVRKKENRPTYNAKARGKLPRACTHSRRRESTPRSHFLPPQSRRRPFFSLFSPLGALMSSSQKRKDHGNYKTLKVSLVSPSSHAQILFPSHPRLPTV